MTDPPPSTSTQNYFENVLPNEIILYIFSFIPSKELVSNVSLVCKKFNTLLGNQQYWKGIIKSRHDVILAECEQKHEAFDARKTFVAIDEAKERWKSWEQQKIKTAFGHIATIDSLMLFNKNSKRFCLSGSRDRSIRLWDVDNIERADDSAENRWTVMTKDDAHGGWIWNFAKDDENCNNFYTTSWDSTVKAWDMAEAEIRETNRVNVGSAAQCVACLPGSNEIVCTTFAKRVAIVDKRTFNVVSNCSFHKRAVIALAVRENVIYSSGEDRLLFMVDRRFMAKPMLLHYCAHSYKSYLSIHNSQLLAAGSNGTVSLFDASKLQVVSSYKVGNFTRQAVINRGAHLVMAKQDRGFKFSIHTPGTKSATICESSELATEPAKFDYSSQTLAIGNGDSSILFAFPQTTQETTEEDNVQP